jgi:hypothetical protein
MMAPQEASARRRRRARRAGCRCKRIGLVRTAVVRGGWMSYRASDEVNARHSQCCARGEEEQRSQQTTRSSTCPGTRMAARCTTKQRAAGGLAVSTTFGRDLLKVEEVRRNRKLKATVES